MTTHNQSYQIIYSNGPPVAIAPNNTFAIDTLTNILYICSNGVWLQLSGGGGAVGANPTAIAGPVAINGVAVSYMRSDAAPAIQKATNAQFGIVEVDGVTITSAAGVISAVGGGPSAANPTAVIGVTVVNGVAATFMRSDAAPPLAAGNVIAGPRSLVYAIGQDNTKHSHTGDTNETKLSSIKIPANTLGANGSFRITTVSSRASGGAGNVTFRIYFSATNDLAGTNILTQAMITTQLSNPNITSVSNRNATNSQVVYVTGNNFSAPTTSAIDTTADAWVVVSGQCANGGDTISIESFVLEFIPAGGN